MRGNNFFNILVCPWCKRKFKIHKKSFQCTLCKNTYPIEKGIPRLIFGEKGIDVKISEEKWDEQYNKYTLAKLLAYRTDPIITSQEAFLFRYKPYFAEKTSLDLGCGFAWSSLFMAKRKAFVVSADISLKALVTSMALLKKFKKPTHFIQANMLSLPLKDKSFDFVYFGLSLQYVKDTQQAVNEAYRVLKNRGRIVAAFPVFSLSTIIYHQLRGGDIPRVALLREFMEFIHITLLKGKYMNYGYGQTFTIGSIKRFFEHAGFRIEKIDYFDVYYPLAFIPGFLRPILRKLIRVRPFWPFAYIEGVKE